MADLYYIVRVFFNGNRRVLQRDMSLEQARVHCQDPESSSSTCKKPHNKRRTRLKGAWFDGYFKEKA